MALGQDDASPVKANGWRQGSILPKPLIAKLRDQGTLPTDWSDETVLIVVSHDCDVTNVSFTAEPFVELIAAHAIYSSDRKGHMQWGKNPRRYQFTSGIGGHESHYELSVHDKLTIPRTRLVDYQPDADRVLGTEDVRSICAWIAKRYTRAAFPDAFNERTRKAINDLRKSFKANGHLLTGIYILVQDDELDADDPYEVTVWATMRENRFANHDERAEAQKLVNEIESALASCKGIDIIATELRAESEVSLSDLRLLKRWDFDDLSLRDLSKSEIPPT